MAEPFNPHVPIGHAAGGLKVSISTEFLRWLQPKPDAVSVAGLPEAEKAQYQRWLVTDADAPAFMEIVTGGGSTVAPVYSDGANWRVG